MAFSWQTIKWKWTAIAGLAITGATIYVASNTRQQVLPVDVIELMLGTYERCEVTRTAEGAWGVAPLSYVATWRDTNGNVTVTNAIGWHPDRAMLVANDAKIKAVIPYYVDADKNTLTVTGLFATLGIGDKTNQFTREPAWTNVAQTNWVVSYTNYWPSKIGATTNICYTSDVQRVVRYATNWISTVVTTVVSGVTNVTTNSNWQWTTHSNWPTIMVGTTNEATYGDLPWQIYVEDLQERYKVLYYLTNTEHHTATATSVQKSGNSASYLPSTTNGHPTIDLARLAAIANYLAYTNTTSATHYIIGTSQENYVLRGYFDEEGNWVPYDAYYCYLVKYLTKFQIAYLSSNIEHKADFYFLPDLIINVGYDYNEFYDQGYGFSEGEWNYIPGESWTTNIGATSDWASATIDDYPAGGSIPPSTNYTFYWRGYYSYGDKVVASWKFLYCTNKFW